MLLSSDPDTYGTSEGTLFLTNVECPLNINDFSDCSFNITQDLMCTDHRNDYLLQCNVREGEPCFPVNEAQFNYQSANVNFSNGVNYYIGYFEICTSDYTYAATCSNALGDNEAVQLCNNQGYETGYAGTLFGTAQDFYPLLTVNGVNEYSCPDNYYSSNIYDCEFNFTEDSGCSEEGGPGLVTCIRGK